MRKKISEEKGIVLGIVYKQEMKIIGTLD